MDEAQKSGLYARLMAIRPPGKNNAQWAVAAGLSRSVFTDIRNRGTARYDTIEKLLAVGGYSWAQFDAAGAAPALPDAESRHHVRTTVQEYRAGSAADLIPTAAPNPELARDIPVLGTAEGAAEPVDANGNHGGHAATVEAMELLVGEVIERKARPTSLIGRREIYALYVSGDSMAPRFERGELVYVDPRRPPAIGDDVIVQLRDSSANEHADPDTVVRVLIKRLAKKRPDAWEFEQFNPALRFTLPTSAIARIHRIMRLDELV